MFEDFFVKRNGTYSGYLKLNQTNISSVKITYIGFFFPHMYTRKGINFRHDIYSLEMNTANIYCRMCKYQLCITYNLFLLTLKVV